MTAKFGPLALGLSTCLLTASACNSKPEVSSTRSGDPGNTGGSGIGGSSSSGTGSGGSGAGEFSLPDAAVSGPPAVASTDANCGLQDFKLERRPAELMLLLDRSGSMQERLSFASPNNKWEEVTPVLDETIMKTAAAIQWGLKVFPGDLLQCNVPDGVEVPIAPDNYAKMSAAITATTPLGVGTPTRFAMDKVVAFLKANPSSNSRYIMLATDGEPNCMDGMTNDLTDPDGAVMSVKAAADAGYKTFVVGIATTDGDANTVLNRMAAAGGEPRAGDPMYYPVGNRQDLITTLGLITGKIADCVFPLDKEPPSPNDVAVDVDGMRQSRDASGTKMSGWNYGAGNKSIEVYGAVCDQIKLGNANVKIIFGCPGVAIP